MLTFDTALALQHEAEDLPAGAGHDVPSRQLMELVRDSDCSAHDCEFVALAMSLGATLVTVDRQLLKAFPRQTAPLRPP